MQSVETQPWAQPHILLVQHGTSRLLPCVSVTEREERRTGRETKSRQTGIGGDQRWYWTVERICVTAISKTITPTAPTRGTGNLLLQPDLIDLTLSHRAPLCRGGRPPQMPAPNSGQAALKVSCTAATFKTSGVVTGVQATWDLFPCSLWHSKDLHGKV